MKKHKKASKRKPAPTSFLSEKARKYMRLEATFRKDAEEQGARILRNFYSHIQPNVES